MSKEITFTIEEQDYHAAIAADPKRDLTCNCVFAKAGERAVGRRVTQAGNWTLFFDNSEFRAAPSFHNVMSNLTNSFDRGIDVRFLLPLTITGTLHDPES